MQAQVQKLLELADIKINGTRLWDIKVNNPKFYQRILADGSLALGESYMDGWWDCKAIDQMIYKIFVSGLNKLAKTSPSIIFHAIKARLINQQRTSKAFEIGRRHYDIGNDLYQAMLDKRMNYSCGYWKNAKTLDEAQESKLELICQKLKLEPGQTVLDIGCGWGALAKYAAKNYHVKVVGITVSKQQYELAKEHCKGLPVEIRLQDYRDLNGQYDKIVSVGMFEHVGYKNYHDFMRVVHNCLKDDGLFLLHTIGGIKSVRSTDPWIGKYIFPRSMLPSAKQIATAAEAFFLLEDWHNFGLDYDKTLMAWHSNINKNWNKIKGEKYDDRFKRMWDYYLLSCAGSFRARHVQLWQIVFSKKGSIQPYDRIR